MGHAAMISLQRGRAPDLPSHPPAIAPVTSWLVSMEALPSPASNPVPLIPPAILFGPSAWPLFKMQMGSTTGTFDILRHLRAWLAYLTNRNDVRATILYDDAVSDVPQM